MPYYIGDVIKDSRKLTARTPEQFRETGIDVRINTRVEAVDPEQRQVHLADGTRLPYDILTLATGMTALKPGIPGEDLEGVFFVEVLERCLAYQAVYRRDALPQGHHHRRRFYRPGDVRKPQGAGGWRCRSSTGKACLRTAGTPSWPGKSWRPSVGKGVGFQADARLVSIEKGDACRLRLNTDQGPVDGDLIILAVGVKPNTAMAREMGLSLGDRGAVRVNLSQRTSREDVYAVGDCAESYHRVMKRWVNIPLGDIANKQGRTAGSTIGGVPRTFPGIVGAQSFRIFHLEVAATGIDEREARESGYDPVGIINWGNATAKALPDVTPIGLKLLADRATGRLLGAQGVGEAGVVGRINALSVALWSDLTLDEIAYLDLAYSPPFGGSWDLIHTTTQALLRKL